MSGWELWTDAGAVERTADICAEVGTGPSTHHLRDAGRTLALTLHQEALAEEQFVEAVARARAAGRALQAAVAPRLESPGAAVARGSVLPHFMKWADPYATDATGAAHLGAILAALDAECTDLPDVRAAVAAMRSAGAAHDDAVELRARAISARVQARTRWNGLVEGVLRPLGPVRVATFLAALPTETARSFPEAAWFDEGDD